VAAEAPLIARPEHASRLVALAQQSGYTARIPLYNTVAAGLIRVVEHGRGTRVSHGVLNDARDTATVIVLGDDDHRTTGPGGWPQAAGLLRWARVVILHGASAEPVHYGMAASGAMVRRRALMVETDAAHLDLWQELTRNVARPETHVCVVAMAPGLVHPRRSAPPGATVQ
jgi:hypothetical protein